MRYAFLFFLIGIIPVLISGQNPNRSCMLWYKQPAKKWEQALPIGNGKLGAMIFGRIQNERIQLNEESIWTRRDTIWNKPEARKYIPVIREALFNENIKLAEDLAKRHILSERLPSGTNTYQTLGDLEITFTDHHPEQAHDYQRSLDLKTATARVTYKIGEIRYTREMISSMPDQTLAIRLTADRPGKLSIQVKLGRPGNVADILNADGCLKMKEHVGGGRGVQFEAWLYPVIKGGILTWEETAFSVEAADEIILYLVAASDYFGGEPGNECRQRIKNLSSKEFSVIYDRHILDYTKLFNRVEIELGTNQAALFPTDSRVDAMSRGLNDPDLAALYFQFGRYLLISSSRPGSLPANLQGIWCDGLKPPWNSDYHININLQMNYWPAEVTNLPECHLPLFDFMENLVPNGRETARTIYGCRGFVAHHTTDVWYPTTPFGLPVAPEV